MSSLLAVSGRLAPRRSSMLGATLGVLLLSTAAASAAPPKAPSLKVGSHRCRVSAEYKLRPCAVERRSDGLWLVVRGEHLVELEALMIPDPEAPKALVSQQSKLVGDRPFPCVRCAPQCATPGACTCQEVPATQQARCAEQAPTLRLARRGAAWVGTVALDLYFGGEPPTVTREQYVIEVR